VIAAAGFGAVSNAPLSGIVARHFTARRGLALGVCGTGTPLGQLVFAPLLALIIESFDWRFAMLAMAGLLVLVVLPVAVIFLGRESAPGASPPGGAAYPYQGIRHTLRTRSYQLLVGAYIICGATTLGLIHTHLIPYALDLGMTQVEGARALGLLGMSNMGGLLAAGMAADRWGARLPLTAVYGFRGLTLLWLAVAGNPSMLPFFVVLFGLVDMATIPLTGAMTATLFGRQAVGALFGLAVVGHQFGSAMGSWLAGVGYVTLGSYQPVLFVGAALALTASFMSFSLEQRGRPRLAPA
jgi:predicted MFS family arabinose efflux permease